ncbi:MAG TPA: asparagine synthase (glutamine-hydrolyzing), partial [Candidatus Omnitrophica bacterium]|nr:asparagine synthase (glutamine-hydrolyzing) [Candidatus Omnitrophota bacterium]
QKPFHYFYKNSSFIFASEIKALLQGDKITREIDFESLDCYLTYGYVFSPKTIFKGINKLPPAHTLTVDKYGMKLERYWKLTYKRKEILREEEYQNGLFSLLKEAVKIRLVSDVPLGAFLSGGIDSSTVAALMCMVSEEPVRTFTIGFKENDYNELVYAREVAMRLGTSHREFIVEPKAFELLPKLIWHYNEPFGDSSCIPTYYVANIARKFVTVALNGDGGDESFAGYERYRAVKLSMVMEKLPPWLLDFSSKMFEQFYWKAPVKSETRYLRHGAEFLKSVILHPNPYSRYLRWISIFKEDEKPSLYTEKLRRCINGYNPGDSFFKIIDESDAGEIVEKIMNADVVSYLPDDLLVKIDIASMANSLEARSPFLDHRLIEFAATMPLTMKLKGFHLKYILKKTMKDILPHKILHRRKMGFGVPVGKWFRGELKSYVYEILLGDRSIKRGYFNKDYVKHLIDEHISGKKNYERRIWALLNFELWHRMFIDNAH